jgi:hypothetical protein
MKEMKNLIIHSQNLLFYSFTLCQFSSYIVHRSKSERENKVLLL